MVLRIENGFLVQTPHLEADIDVAGEGVEGGPLGLLLESAETRRIKLGELGRNVHQGAELRFGELRRGGGEAVRVVGEAGGGRLERRDGTLIVERLRRGDDCEHPWPLESGGATVNARRKPLKTEDFRHFPVQAAFSVER